jgi:cytoskeletal protein CcmA (bactofilin family)
MRDWRGGGPRSRNGALVVSRGVTIVGALSVEGDVLVEGTVDGDVRCSRLEVAERGAVEGLIVAERVVILGEFAGIIYARELFLGAGCAVEGQIFHNKLVLEQGSYFEGKSRRHGDPLLIAPVPKTHARGDAGGGLHERVA